MRRLLLSKVFGVVVDPVQYGGQFSRSLSVTRVIFLGCAHHPIDFICTVQLGGPDIARQSKAVGDDFSVRQATANDVGRRPSGRTELLDLRQQLHQWLFVVAGLTLNENVLVLQLDHLVCAKIDCEVAVESCAGLDVAEHGIGRTEADVMECDSVNATGWVLRLNLDF